MADSSAPRMFVVTTGLHADLAVDSLWTTRKAAQIYIYMTPLEEPQILEMVVNETTLVDHQRWSARTELIGNTLEVKCHLVAGQIIREPSARWSSFHKDYVGVGYGASPKEAQASLRRVIAYTKAYAEMEKKIPG